MSMLKDVGKDQESSKAKKGLTFQAVMDQKMEALKNDPETKDRYALAGWSGRAWFAFSAWIAEDRTRWTDETVVQYRDALARCMMLTDIAYVLQFETEREVVDYLKDRLVEAADRETTEGCLSHRRGMLKEGVVSYRERLGIACKSDVHSVQFGGGMGSLNNCLHRLALRKRLAYLTGEINLSSQWACCVFFDEHKPYEKWERTARVEIPQRLVAGKENGSTERSTIR